MPFFVGMLYIGIFHSLLIAYVIVTCRPTGIKKTLNLHKKYLSSLFTITDLNIIGLLTLKRSNFVRIGLFIPYIL
jgi:hypothetical protein